MSVDPEPPEEPAALPEPPAESRITKLRARLGGIVGAVGQQAVTAIAAVGRRAGRQLEATLTGADTSVTYNGHHITVDGDEEGIAAADALFAGAVDGHDLVVEYDRTHGLTVEILVESETPETA